MQSRIIALEGVRNFRDFGGYASRFGGHVKAGRLFRSGHFAEATEADLEALSGLSIALQADLRRPDERERMVDKWQAAVLISHDGGRESEAPHQRFLRQVEASPEKADNWMNEYYQHAPFKAHHQTIFSNWFKKLADLEQSALVNCAAGKDRTGILCALTLHVLGVSEADIMFDYELTNVAAKVEERLPEATDYFNKFIGKDYEPDVYKPFLGVRERYLETAFGVMCDRHGSMDAYLAEALGVTEALRETLVMRLTEELVPGSIRMPRPGELHD